MQLNEKGYYFTVLILGLFSASPFKKLYVTSWKVFQ
ncbi:MAG: hypothetical protein WDM90_23955 [Ferruginibacter sp.]